jgi:DNA-directed RNA polymerase subunit RPC12/RpoP
MRPIRKKGTKIGATMRHRSAQRTTSNGALGDWIRGGGLAGDREPASLAVQTMGQVLKLTCSQCSLDETGCRTIAYVLNLESRRQFCRHPGQDEHTCKILGIEYEEVLRAMGESTAHGGAEAKYKLPDGAAVTAAQFEAFFMDRCGVACGYLCLVCARWSNLDEHRDPLQCPHCRSENIVMDEKLDGRACPFCKRGSLKVDMLGQT